MKALRLDEIRQAIRAQRVAAGDDLTITGATIDTRTAQAGDLYFAIRGERFDGHDFLAGAADAGCLAAIVRRGFEPPAGLAERFPGGLLGVDDPTAALGRLAAWYRKMLPATIIGVTGSNGKTTVKRMIHHVLSRSMTGSSSPKSFNNQYGVPLTLLAAGATDEFVVCEIGTSAPGEIGALGAIARPDLAVITSVSPAHLEGLGSIERIAAEKASLLGAASGQALAVVCGDMPDLVRAAGRYTVRTVLFGQSPDCHLRLTAYEPTEWGARFQVNGRLWVALPCPGRHNAINALATIAVAQRFGLPQEAAAEALSTFSGEEMRLQREQIGGLTVINDAYNANPASVLAAGEVLADISASRRVMVVGDMRELGEQGPELHRQVGQKLGRLADVVVGVGELGSLVAEAAEDAGERHAFADVKRASRALPAMLRAGDVVLLKGSRAMELEKLLAPLHKAFADQAAGKTRRGGARK